MQKYDNLSLDEIEKKCLKFMIKSRKSKILM